MLIIGGIVISLMFDISKESDIDISESESLITINKDTSTNSGSIVNGKGDTLYLIRNDSVLIDKVGKDTTKINDYRQ